MIGLAGPGAYAFSLDFVPDWPRLPLLVGSLVVGLIGVGIRLVVSLRRAQAGRQAT